jgi:hypothetical protein
MQDSNDKSARHSLLDRALDWWRASTATWQRMHELEMLSDAEIERMARDIGVTPDEFMRLAQMPNGSAALLARRLEALDLDPEEIRELSSFLYADLQRTCALCQEHGRCTHDLDERPQSQDWRSYCPNAGTLRMLT